MIFNGTYYSAESVCGKCGRSTAKVKACDRLFSGMLAAHKVNFVEQRINVAVAHFFIILYFAIRAEIADILAKRDMHVKPKIFAVFERQFLVVFIVKRKRLCRSCKPHPC
jgi:hypothetical protein